MKVSVIIPIYNCEKYLHKCFDSIVNQTFKNMEIIAVNDGSTDGSQAIIDDYAKKYPSIFFAYYQENAGQGNARNLGLTKATGDFLGFVDSDDWIDLDLYEKMVNKAESEQLDVVVCDMFDHYDNHTDHHLSSHFTDVFKITPSACNKLFRRSITQGITFPKGIWYEDFEFTTKILFITNHLGAVHDSGYHCHCREVSTMVNDNAPKNLDMLEVFEHFKLYLAEKQLTEKFTDTLNYLIINHILITSINRVALQNHPEKDAVIKKMINYVKENCFDISASLKRYGYTKQKRIIATLNLKGLYNLSKILLNLKKVMK